MDSSKPKDPRRHRDRESSHRSRESSSRDSDRSRDKKKQHKDKHRDKYNPQKELSNRILEREQNSIKVNALFNNTPGHFTGLSSREVDFCRQNTPIVKKPTYSLYMPDPNDTLKPINNKPEGCRSILINNLPAVATENMCAEVFVKFGKIDNLKLDVSKTTGKITKFCLLKYLTTESTDSALEYNGYHLVIASPGGVIMPHQVSQIEINYVADIENVQEWKQDEAMITKMANNCPPFSETEATRIFKFLTQPDKFIQSMKIVIEWCENSFCTSITSKTFYSFTSSAIKSLQKVSYLVQSYSSLVKRNRESEAVRRKEINEHCDVVETFFRTYLRADILKAFNRSHQTDIDEHYRDANKIILETQKGLAYHDALVFPSEKNHNTSNNNSNSDMDKKIIKSLCEEKLEITERNKSIALENAKLIVQLNKMKGDNDKLQTIELENAKLIEELNKIKGDNGKLQSEIEELKKSIIEKEKSAEVLSKNKDELIKTLQEGTSAFEKYIKHVCREREKGKMFDELISTGKIEGIASIEEETLESSKETLISKVKKEVDDEVTITGCKRGLEDNTTTDSKRRKLGGHLLSSQELILLPAIAIFLHSLPQGASVTELSSLFSGSNIKIEAHTLMSILTKFSTIFKLNSLSDQQRWRVIVFDYF